ncbi:hypothetical protein ABIE44_003442 [Marmoricola sp. OAE513]|uniref:HAD family acid phosphatase n=1 Tax=Marmoricola sp. OAE513 TaxID=2817894 RepID=UPI001AE82CAC
MKRSLHAAALLMTAALLVSCGADPERGTLAGATPGTSTSASAAASTSSGTTTSRPVGLPSKKVWLADVRKAMTGSTAYLDAAIAKKKPGQRLAIVLDIDNTSIASKYAWPRPVKVTKAFATHAVSRGVTVFFATGRNQGTLGQIKPVLTKAGYRYAGVCGRKGKETLPQGKQRCRNEITAQGYTIVATVGNRKTDLVGTLVGRGFKLPSYNKRLS